LVNQIIKEHLNWHSNATKAWFIAVRRPFVSWVINNLSEQEIISLAEYVAKTTNKDVILLIKKRVHGKISPRLLAIMDKNIWISIQI
jgi:hypothetical protein